MAHSWVKWDPITPLLQRLPIFQNYTVSPQAIADAKAVTFTTMTSSHTPS